MTQEQITQDKKEYHLKRLVELSLKLIGKIPQLDELNEEQAEWTKNKMKSGRWNK